MNLDNFIAFCLCGALYREKKGLSFPWESFLIQFLDKEKCEPLMANCVLFPDGTAAEPSSSSSMASSIRHSLFPRTSVPFLRRQERLNDSDPPNALQPGDGVNAAGAAPSASVTSPNSPFRDHGLRTPPGPPTPLLPPLSLAIRTRRGEQQRMAHEMVEYLVPPSRSSMLSRAHTDPSSQTYHRRQLTPVSPPPAYEEVVKEPRVAPPSYEEALSTQTSSLRLNPRSLSHDEASGSHPSPPPPFRGRSNVNQFASSLSVPSPRPSRLTRSSRAEEIPDIYWEQAARELDFCTCRKCQVRFLPKKHAKKSLKSCISGQISTVFRGGSWCAGQWRFVTLGNSSFNARSIIWRLGFLFFDVNSTNDIHIYTSLFVNQVFGPFTDTSDLIWHSLASEGLLGNLPGWHVIWSIIEFLFHRQNASSSIQILYVDPAVFGRVRGEVNTFHRLLLVAHFALELPVVLLDNEDLEYMAIEAPQDLKLLRHDDFNVFPPFFKKINFVNIVSHLFLQYNLSCWHYLTSRSARHYSVPDWWPDLINVIISLISDKLQKPIFFNKARKYTIPF